MAIRGSCVAIRIYFHAVSICQTPVFILVPTLRIGMVFGRSAACGKKYGWECGRKLPKNKSGIQNSGCLVYGIFGITTAQIRLAYGRRASRQRSHAERGNEKKFPASAPRESHIASA